MLKSQNGFSLIEILVSVVVLSLGLLGAVGMQLSALQGNREAQLQASGVRFARELAELMRGNQTVASLAAKNPYLIEKSFDSSPAIDNSPADCYASVCAMEPPASQGEKVAGSDMSDWQRRLSDAESGLPGAKFIVCYDESPYDANGLPEWECTNTGSIAYIKIGWSTRSVNRAAAGKAGDESTIVATSAVSRPGVVQAVIAGVQGN